MLISPAPCAALPPVSVRSGNVTLSTNGSVTFATYNCPQGYVVNIASTLTCGADGNWDQQPSDCGINANYVNIYLNYCEM